MFHPHRSFSGVLSSPSSTEMSEGEPDAKATEVASPSKEVDDVAAEVADAAEAGEDTPLVGKKIEVVVKDEHEKADVTTTAVTDEGVCVAVIAVCDVCAFVIVIGHIMFELMYHSFSFPITF